MSQYIPEPGYYVHQDGGLYFVNEIATSTVDQSEYVCYQHLFPFEQKTWLRPLHEWTVERFSPASDLDVHQIRSQHAETLRQKITDAKIRRRARRICTWCDDTGEVKDAQGNVYVCKCGK